jgi:AraC-like DNA-binding protein
VCALRFCGELRHHETRMGDERQAATKLPVEEAGPLGFRFSCGAEGDTFRVKRGAPTLLFPLDASIVSLRIDSSEEARLVDRSAFVLVPSGERAHVSAVSAVCELLELFPSDALLDETVAMYGGEIERAKFDAYLARAQQLPRTTWVNELAHRYLFERVVCRKSGTLAARFVEIELVKELYFLARERAEHEQRTSRVTERSGPVARALAYLEQHLFEPFTVDDLARRVGASASTLLRAFRREMRASPAAYVRTRRLDEAMVLLRTGRYAVGEVALRVGYGNLAAFTAAFHRRFAVPPSRVREGKTGREAASVRVVPKAARTRGTAEKGARQETPSKPAS